MKSIIRGLPELTVRKLACLSLGLALAGCASDSRPVVVGQQPMAITSLNEYCAVAQKEIATSRVPARNVLVGEYQAFSRASPSVKPLETLQYIGYADSQHTRARMISCKLHSAERIRAEYGATAAGESTTCARLNRRTLDAVMLTLTDRQKKKMPFRHDRRARCGRAGANDPMARIVPMVQTDAGGSCSRARACGDGNMRVSSKAATAAASIAI